MATIKSFSDIVTDLKAGLIAANSKFTDLLPGSRIYAVVSSLASALALGWIGLAEIKTIFFVNSATGTDLDNRVGDLGMRRNQGSKATGAVLAFTSTPVTIPAGTLLRTVDSKVILEVVQDKNVTSPFSALSVISVEVGSNKNLSAGSILLENDGRFANVIFKVGSQGVDTNGNPVGKLTGGTDRESDELLKGRFTDYLTSLSRGTIKAVSQALKQIAGISSLVIENAMPVPGYIRISVSDGSGTISQTISDAVAAVMEAWASAGYGYVLQSIARTEVAVSVTAYTTDLTVSPSAIQAAVSTKINALGQNLQLGQSLYRADITRVGFVSGLENFTVQSPVQDTIAGAGELLGIDSITVNVVYV